MDSASLLLIFLCLRIGQFLLETSLSFLNHRYVQDKSRQDEAARVLAISSEAMQKSAAYAKDRFHFGLLSNTLNLALTLAFLGLGGLGLLEQKAASFLGDPSQVILQGLLFLGGLGLLSSLVSLPFDLYYTFVIEQKHGFNRQTLLGFCTDQLKSLALALLLGAPLLAALLWVMGQAGAYWWVYAWLLLFTFSLLTAWLYPALLAPLFNKFSPLPDGSLKQAIFALARQVDFDAESISIMDASRRSSHGNAYFTGVFGKKRIVLFDTLIKSMTESEVVAVLAHELGHFKLHHVRWSLIRSFFVLGAMFFALSLCLPLETFYQSFQLAGVSNYGALVIFSLWFGPIQFLLNPLFSQISRRNEFQADAFALKHIENRSLLSEALLKLRENSHLLPLSHPWYSHVYHSHPPLLERLKAMGYFQST